MSVSLRPFPYPFRAALAICNDADLFTVADYRRVQAFLGTDADTEWGPGLSLDLGGSFFMYRSPDSPNEFTVFDRLTDTITDDGEFILAAAQRGELDVLHTYGCFTDASHFTRAMAEKAIEVLRARGIAIQAWVNHGPPSNVQGLGGRDEWQGDVAGTAAYHADLTVAYGVRWLWTGSEMTDRIALDGRRRLLKRTGPLVEPYTLRDGQEVQAFRRFTGLGGRTPVLEDLPQQLSPSNLDELVKGAGYAIVYQHLAVRRRGEGFGTDAYGPVGDERFTEAEVAGLRELARRHHDGEIWVAPTTRLLRHHELQHTLQPEVRREEARDVIAIGAGCPGLTVYCERPDATDVMIGGTRADLRVNPPDTTGQGSITLL